MAKEEKTTEESTQTTELPEVPAQEPAPAPEDKAPEQTSEPVPSYQNSVKALRAEYDKKFNDQREKYEAEIRERDEVIKQIMTEPSEGASEPAGDPITDKINAKRHFIKW